MRRAKALGAQAARDLGVDLGGEAAVGQLRPEVGTRQLGQQGARQAGREAAALDPVKQGARVFSPALRLPRSSAPSRSTTRRRG